MNGFRVPTGVSGEQILEALARWADGMAPADVAARRDAGTEGLTTGEAAARLGITPGTMTARLRLLRQAGLAESVRMDGRSYVWRPVPGMSVHADRHREKPLSLRLGPLRQQVEEAAAEAGVPVRRWILGAVAGKLARETARVCEPPAGHVRQSGEGEDHE